MIYRKFFEILLPAVLIAALAVSSALSQSEKLTPQEKRGKQIYLQGTGSSGREITALLGDARTEVPASMLPCAPCSALPRWPWRTTMEHSAFASAD